MKWLGSLSVFSVFSFVLPPVSYLDKPLKQLAMEQDEELAGLISLHYQIIDTK